MEESTDAQTFQSLLVFDLKNINLPLKPSVSDAISFEEAGIGVKG